MIYNANMVYNYNTALKDYDHIIETAYSFIYESDYNFNFIINEINLYESKALQENMELILESIDIKSIFESVRRLISNAFRRFLGWLKDIRDKIRDVFKKKGKNKKEVEDALNNAKKENITINGYDVSNKKAEDLKNRMKQSIDFESVDKCKTVEDVDRLKYETARKIFNISETPNSQEEIVELAEKELGLNKKVNIIDTISVDDIINTSNSISSIDDLARLSDQATKKAENEIDKVANNINENQDSSKYKVCISKANAYRYMANILYTVSTAISKSYYIKEKQINKIDEDIISKKFSNFNKKDNDEKMLKSVEGKSRDEFRYIFADSLEVDPTFERYKIVFNYAKENGIFEDYAEGSVPLTNDISEWNESYWIKLKRDLVKNLSIKRLNHMRKVAKVFLREKYIRIMKERESKG